MARPLAIVVFLIFAMAALARLTPISGGAAAEAALTPAASASGGRPPPR
jgi:hypothetical protein